MVSKGGARLGPGQGADSLDGPWTDLVRAEVEFANGNRERALQLVQRASRQRAPEVHAPDELPKMIEAASARYGR